MIFIGATMKTWIGRTTAHNGGGGVEVKKTGTGRDREREEGREISTGLEKGGESISLAMTAKRREYLDLYSHLIRLYASSLGSSKLQSLCTIKSLKCSCKNQKTEIDNIKFNSKILKGSINLITLDNPKSHIDSCSLKDSRRMNSKDKNLTVSCKTPGEDKSPNKMKNLSLRGGSSRIHQGSRGLTQPSTSRKAPLCLRPSIEAWR